MFYTVKQKAKLIILVFSFTLISCQSVSDYGHNGVNSKIDVINDVNILMDFAKKTDELISKNQTKPIKELAKQLKTNKKFNMKLTPSSQKKLGGEALFEKNKEATILVGNAFVHPHTKETYIDVSSGFVISEDGICVTNFHVMQAYLQDQIDGNKNLAAVVRDYSGNVYVITEILASSQKDDIAVFKIDTKGKKMKFATLASNPKVGSDISVISHPNNMLYVMTKGIISRYYMGEMRTEVMNITAAYAAGSSGAPVFDNSGNIVGVVSSTYALNYNRDPGNHQMVLRQCVPVEKLKKLLK